MFSVLQLTFFSVFCLAVFFRLFWQSRWLLRSSMNLPGPFSIPFVGSPILMFAGQKKIFNVLLKLFAIYPSVWKGWIGPQLCIVTSRSQDVEILLTNQLKKDNMILLQFINNYINSIFTSDVMVWKAHRRVINQSFNLKVIDSFHNIFCKYANILVRKLDEESMSDVLMPVWRCTLDTACETLTTVEPSSFERDSDKFLRNVVRFEEIITERSFSILYYFDVFWRRSSFNKEINKTMEEIYKYVKMIVTTHKTQTHNNNDQIESKRFLNQLLQAQMSDEEIFGESVFMLMASSETTAITLCFVLLILSIHQDIQEKVFVEQQSIFGAEDRDPTLEEMNEMTYLERVIKETMRLVPTVPMIGRYIDETTKIDGYMFPKGCMAVFPIYHIHRREDIWPDPLTFNPDRFLPEEIEKRPRCSYIPFSYSSRNCVGVRYGMMSMKVILSAIIRKLKIQPSEYKKIDDIEMIFHVVMKPKRGFKMGIERRLWNKSDNYC